MCKNCEGLIQEKVRHGLTWFHLRTQVVQRQRKHSVVCELCLLQLISALFATFTFNLICSLISCSHTMSVGRGRDTPMQHHMIKSNLIMESLEHPSWTSQTQPKIQSSKTSRYRKAQTHQLVDSSLRASGNWQGLGNQMMACIYTCHSVKSPWHSHTATHWDSQSLLQISGTLLEKRLLDPTGSCQRHTLPSLHIGKKGVP